MGDQKVTSFMTGLLSRHEYRLPLVDKVANQLDAEIGDRNVANKLLVYQRRPADWQE